ncbi:hypothetical protein [Nostoc sp.]|uniref:hypothetical protein n=1 Tax=Nostoc sp. TaxID=1180 RepID=UPI002FFD4B56
MFTDILMRSLFVIGGIEYFKYLNQRNRGLQYAIFFPILACTQIEKRSQPLDFF